VTPALADLAFTAAGRRYVAAVYAPTDEAPEGDWLDVVVHPAGADAPCGYAVVDASGSWTGTWARLTGVAWPAGVEAVARGVVLAWWQGRNGGAR
jgi:hypothetical protein